MPKEKSTGNARKTNRHEPLLETLQTKDSLQKRTFNTNSTMNNKNKSKDKKKKSYNDDDDDGAISDTEVVTMIEEDEDDLVHSKKDSDQLLEESDDNDSVSEDDGSIMDDTSINNEVTEAEENIINMFLSNNTNNNGTINLSDLIFEKLNQKNNNATLMNNTFSENMNNTNDDNNLDSMTNNQLPIKIITVYTSVGKLLHHYKTGKLPKALKMLPYLKNWEEILWLTRPDQWSPSATYACTRIFVSNLNDKMTQRYYNLVLLEKCRDDIRHNDKLNFYMYMSLKKALFKPAAFYKGILLPLVKSMTCTLREAIIFGSVIAKVSIASNHSAAVLIKLSEMEYCGSTSVFIKILLNKKYSFPMKVIDSMINHFLSFMDEERQLPVVWHQSLLVFVQRYREQINESAKNSFKALLKKHYHHMITPEIRRELFNSNI